MSLNDWLLKTRYLFDNELDLNWASSAYHFRLERFQNWFKDQGYLTQECESNYEKRFLADLESDHKVVLRQDPYLGAARLRHHYLLDTGLILMYPATPNVIPVLSGTLVSGLPLIKVASEG
ncbi:uncharacterized protein N7483_006855 [Penicillium malachiteum]|uniref:uncharacterized protein n=1 Tax=Penicillium malachiteum TaxID=1324776 RepID=UPI002548286B|nr:uncharacterized protein N7483_006855 [Penicillium malachiteum]KAJ5725498.1 hypothetical protein N7483_006855 [Penicillium malachiteum]